jgi:hypothetical protein
MDRWRLDYNHRRRQSAVGYRTPSDFAATCVLEESATLRPPEHRTTTDLRLSHSEWHKIWGVGQDALSIFHVAHEMPGDQ